MLWCEPHPNFKFAPTTITLRANASDATSLGAITLDMDVESMRGVLLENALPLPVRTNRKQRRAAQRNANRSR